MSLWDVFLIVMVCIAIFRGYFKGLCRRLTDWVGVVIAFLLSVVSLETMNTFVSQVLHVNGKEKITEWLTGYFEYRVAANPSNQLESLKQWVADLFLPSQIKESLYTTIDDSANQIYESIYSQVARVLSDPIWDFILCILGIIVFFTVLIVVGELCGLLVHRFNTATMIDRFLGAIASGFLVIVVLGLFSALLVFIVPESAGALGRSLHNSLMAPMLQQALDTIIKGGMIS